MRLHGDSVRLPARLIHMPLDAPSTYALVAYNDPSMLEVYRIKADRKLEWVRKYDIDNGAQPMFWMGMVTR